MINHRALLDEIVKIGEANQQQVSNKDRLISALKTVGIAAVGGAAGHGAANLMEHAFPRFMQAQKPVQSSYVKAVQIGLPILGALGLSLGNKYRHLVDQGLSGNSMQNDSRSQQHT